MRALVSLVRKEMLLLSRDWHALALLFVMPAFFILVMSLAMRDMFKPGREGAFSFYLVNNDSTPLSARLADGISAHKAFRSLGAAPDSERVDAIRRGKVPFAVVIPKGFIRAMVDSQPLRLSVLTGPAVNGQTAQLFAAAVREAVSSVYVQAKLITSMPMVPGMAGGGLDSSTALNLETLLDEQTLYRSSAESSENGASQRPTSVQQNVPAWLVFAMFFVALPLSTTWLQERTQGTFAKLRSVGLRPSVLLAGKLLPYLAVNLVQVVVMLAVGLWAVPALGGDALTLGHSFPALLLMAVSVGIAAVSYALLIANLVATTEQATILTGASNLLLGALGGVMVPRNVMPAGLQSLSNLSPMAWGLEGFLDVMLRDGTVRTVAPRAALLLAFACAALVVAGLRLQRNRTT